MYKKRDIKTDYYLRMLLSAGWLFAYPSLFSQDTTTALYCYLNNSNAYDNYAIYKITNSSEIDTIFTIYQIKITDKRTGKLKEEYYRHNDSCFQFLEYDSTGEVIKRGLLELHFTGKIDTSTYEVPWSDNDPVPENQTMKDTVLYDSIYKYRPTGKWKEKDSTGYIWKGTYANGKKEGKWQRGTRFVFHHSSEALSKMYDYFRPFDTHYFENGIELSVTARKPLWPLIEGKWYYNLLNSQDSTIWCFSRDIPGGHPSRTDWDFTSRSAVKMYCIAKNEIHPSLKSLSWQYKENTLTMNYCQGKMDFEIIDLTPTYMILRRFHNGQPKH